MLSLKKVKKTQKEQKLFITCCCSSFHLCLQRNTAWTSSAGATWFPNMEFATTSSMDSSAASPVLSARGHKLAVQCTYFGFFFFQWYFTWFVRMVKSCLWWRSGGCWWSHSDLDHIGTGLTTQRLDTLCENVCFPKTLTVLLWNSEATSHQKNDRQRFPLAYVEVFKKKKVPSFILLYLSYYVS